MNSITLSDSKKSNKNSIIITNNCNIANKCLNIQECLKKQK